jgi:DNA-binding CsgD family transcriptional regulator
MAHSLRTSSLSLSSSLLLDTTLTSEEAIVLRSLVAGKTEKQVCHELRISPALLLRILRDLREKTATTDRCSLVVWAHRQMRGLDQRVDRRERYERPI